MAEPEPRRVVTFWQPWRRLLAVGLGVAGLLYAGGGLLTGSEHGLVSVTSIVVPAVAAALLMLTYGQKKFIVPRWFTRGWLIGLAVLFSAVLRISSNASATSLIGHGVLSFMGGVLIAGAFVVQD
jgi:hypothetical protein